MLGREGAAPGQHASVSAKKVSAWLNSSVGRDEIMPEFIRLPIDVVAIGGDSYVSRDKASRNWCLERPINAERRQTLPVSPSAIHPSPSGESKDVVAVALTSLPAR
jgi:hypothetical protein